MMNLLISTLLCETLSNNSEIMILYFDISQYSYRWWTLFISCCANYYFENHSYSFISIAFHELCCCAFETWFGTLSNMMKWSSEVKVETREKGKIPRIINLQGWKYVAVSEEITGDERSQWGKLCLWKSLECSFMFVHWFIFIHSFSFNNSFLFV